MLKQRSYTRITLALDIICKVKQGNYKGFHELKTIKHLIDLYDLISIRDSSSTRIICDDTGVPKDNSNLCIRSVELIKNQFGIKKDVEISIKKQIPIMSGLAGASSNAATTILLMNQHWKLNLSLNEMMEISREIGMDVPYYFFGGTCLDNEVGTITKISDKLNLDFVIVTPDFGISTKKAYSNIDYGVIGKDMEKTEEMIEHIQKDESEKAVNLVHNDFEKILLPDYPELKQIMEKLKELGCIPFLTGSGSSIVGIAESDDHAVSVSKKLKWNTIVTKSYNSNEISEK